MPKVILVTSPVPWHCQMLTTYLSFKLVATGERARLCSVEDIVTSHQSLIGWRWLESTRQLQRCCLQWVFCAVWSVTFTCVTHGMYLRRECACLCSLPLCLAFFTGQWARHGISLVCFRSSFILQDAASALHYLVPVQACLRVKGRPRPVSLPLCFLLIHKTGPTLTLNFISKHLRSSLKKGHEASTVQRRVVPPALSCIHLHFSLRAGRPA